MTEQNPAAKKGKPTPPRKKQEAARKRPLVAPRTKEGKQAAAAKARSERLAAREGYAAGDDKFLPKRDSGPQKRLIRDTVDSGWFTVGELLFPAMILSFIPMTDTCAAYMSLMVLTLFVVYLAETFVIARRAKKLLIAKFGAGKLESGIWMYVAFRALYPRIMRLPKAQVPRGHKL